MDYDFEEREYWEIERGADKYSEIENFKDYELTECIAYEMAHRRFMQNLDDMKLITKWINVLIEEMPKSYIPNRLHKDQSLQKLEFSIDDIEKFDPGFKYYYAGTSFLGCKYYFSEIFEPLKDVEDCSFTLYPGDRFQKIQLYKDETYNDEGRLKTKIIESSQRTIDIEKLMPPRKARPSIPKEKSKVINIKLNLALPKDELLAYVAAIKDNYDKDHSTISFERKVEPSDALDEIQKRRNASGKLPNAKKMAYADMFFIYDCLNAASDDEIDEAIMHIKDEIKEYYTQKIMEHENINKGAARIKARNIDPKTIHRYYELMQDFIDNERYKELLTGEMVE